MSENESSSNFGLWIVGLGLVLAITARGMDNLQLRHMTKLQSELSQARNEGDPDTIEAKAEQLENKGYSNSTNSYYFEWLFLVGTILLAVGLMVSAALGQDKVRFLAMVMMSLVLVSLYIGGVAWIGSVISTVKGASGF